MKTHLLRPGSAMPPSERSSSTLCKTNRGHVVDVSKDLDDVDCGRCIRMSINARESGKVYEDNDAQTLDDRLGAVVVHFGSEVGMIEPDGRSFCRRKIINIEDSYTTDNPEEVSCTSCKTKMSRRS